MLFGVVACCLLFVGCCCLRLFFVGGPLFAVGCWLLVLLSGVRCSLLVGRSWLLFVVACSCLSFGVGCSLIVNRC